MSASGGSSSTTTVVTVQQGVGPEPQREEYVRGIVPMIGDALLGAAGLAKKAIYVKRTTPAQSMRATDREVRQAERHTRRLLAKVDARIRDIEAQEDKASTRDELRRLGMRRATQVAMRTHLQQDLDKVCNIGNLVEMDVSGNHVEDVQTSYLQSVRARHAVTNPARIQRAAMAGQKLLTEDGVMRDMKKDLGMELDDTFNTTLEEAIEADDAVTEDSADCKTPTARGVDERVEQLMEKKALLQKSALPSARGGDVRAAPNTQHDRDKAILERMARLRPQ